MKTGVESTRRLNGLCFARGWEISNGVVYIAYTVDDIANLIRSIGAVVKDIPALNRFQFETIKANLENIRTMLILQSSKHSFVKETLQSFLLGMILLL